jgi:hypothetical protein
VGVDPSGADGSGADAAVTGPALDDSSWVDDPGGWGSRSWRQLEVRNTGSTNEVEVSQHIS